MSSAGERHAAGRCSPRTRPGCRTITSHSRRRRRGSAAPHPQCQEEDSKRSPIPPQPATVWVTRWRSDEDRVRDELTITRRLRRSAILPLKVDESLLSHFHERAANDHHCGPDLQRLGPPSDREGLTALLHGRLATSGVSWLYLLPQHGPGHEDDHCGPCQTRECPCNTGAVV